MKKFDFLETEYHLEKKYLGFTGKGSFTYSGKIKSFSTIVKVNPDWKDCFITIQAQKDNEEITLIDLLKRNEVLKETNITINDNSSFTISYKIPFFASSNKKRFDEIIETTISILKKNFYNPNIILVEEKEEEFSNFENFNYKEKFKNLDEIKIEYNSRKENIFLGILGVIGVSLLAIIAHIICDVFLQYHPFIVYALLASASCYTYKKLADKISKKSSIFIFIILIISLFIATILSFIFSFYHFYNDGGVLLSEAFQKVPPIIINDFEVRELFIEDILINAVVLTISFIIAFFKIFQEEIEYSKFKK